MAAWIAGALIGIPFPTAFHDAGERAKERTFRKNAEYQALENVTAGLQLAGEMTQSGMPPFPIERIADHAPEVAGPAHAAIGSELDGVDRRPEGLADASDYPALIDALRGCSGRRRGKEMPELPSRPAGSLGREGDLDRVREVRG